MLKIPATDNKTYRVPSWSVFRAWVYRLGIAYGVLAVAFCVGIWAYGNHAQSRTISEINRYAAKSCVTSRSTLLKYNGLVLGVIDSRTAQLDLDLRAGDNAKVRADKLALKHYAVSFLPVPTLEQCHIPILK